MKRLFPLFYSDVKSEKIKAIKNGLIFLDTNVLLHFFRLGESFAHTFFQMLEKVQDRVYIPYQVAKEYHPKYLELCISLYKSYENAIKETNNLKNPVKQLSDSKADYVRFLDKGFKREVEQEFIAQVEKVKRKYEEAIQFLKNELEEGDLFAKVGNFFSNKVLEKLSPEEMESIIKKGKDRYDKQIPPGYLDEKKGDNIYGDLIIWEEIIKFISSKPEINYAIFVSDDVKEDWILKICGEKHGPRYELIEEFSSRANARFFKMTVDSFIDAIQIAYNAVDDADAQQAQEASTIFQNMNQSSFSDKIVRSAEKMPYKDNLTSDSDQDNETCENI